MAVLLALIQEEFGFEIDAPEELEHLQSFAGIYGYVRSRLACGEAQ
jgi:acyl carrier protein